MSIATSCGTLIIKKRGVILLCHVTGTQHWDIPKGLQDPGETPLGAAVRELHEETGLAFSPDRFVDLGPFSYRRDKQLHLFRVDAPDDFDDLGHLICTSHFMHHVTGEPTPEMDGFCWATRDEIRTLCWPRMAGLLLKLEW